MTKDEMLITRRMCFEKCSCSKCKRVTEKEKEFRHIDDPVVTECQRCYREYCEKTKKLVEERFRLMQNLIWKANRVFGDWHTKLCKVETYNQYHTMMLDWANTWNQRVYEVLASTDVAAMEKMSKDLEKELDELVKKMGKDGEKSE